MSRAITIELDRAPTFSPGETISGLVCVEAAAQTECRELVITLQRLIDGVGHRITSKVTRVALFKGRWAPGQHVYAFELPIDPGSAPTYQGSLLRIDWQLEATADVPWSIDPKEVVPLVLVSGPNPPTLTEAQATPRSRDTRPVDRTALVWVGMLFALVGVLIFALSFALWQVGRALQLMGAATALAGGTMLYYGLRNRVAGEALGDVELRVPSHSAPGQEIPCVVRFTPSRAVQVNAISLKLLGVESVTSGTGQDRQTMEVTFCEQEAELVRAPQLRAGEPFEARGVVRVPDDAPTSLLVSSRTLRWVVRASVDIARWPDWVARADVIVLPRRA